MTAAQHDPFSSLYLYGIQDPRKTQLVCVNDIDELVPDHLLEVFTPGGRELLLHQIIMSAHNENWRVGGPCLHAEKEDNAKGTSVKGLVIKTSLLKDKTVI